MDPDAPQDPHGLKRLPDSLPMATDRSPCEQNDCRACCFDTRMPLLESDLKRLEAHTGIPRDDFSEPDDPHGPRRLSNTDGHCVFLAEQGCTVYPQRPAGCRLYPLVLDPDTNQGVLDTDCPHTRGFKVRPKDRAALKELVERLGLDAS